MYEELDEALAQIRLVTIEAGSEDSQITCTLKTTSLGDQPCYESLSYVWGDPKERLEILLNYHLFPVTTNLEAALRRLRLDTAPRVMWIDAICINQANLNERAAQVLLMRDIYSAATQTVVWLGEETEESRQALNPGFLESLSDIYNALRPSPGDWQSAVSSFQTKADEYVSSFPSAIESAKCFWEDVLARPWWNRVWVIQEIALASTALFMCGRASMSYTDFVGLGMLLMHCRRGQIKESNPYVEWDTVRRMERFEQTRAIHDLYDRGIMLSITQLVACFAQRGVSDQRDLVYGLLGLADDVDYTILRPEYGPLVSSLDVCIDLVKHSVLKEKCLDIVSIGQGAEATDAETPFPSWTMRWSGLRHVGPENMRDAPIPLLWKYQVVELKVQHPQRFRAASAVLPCASVTKSPPTLTCRGIFLDVVQVCADRIGLWEVTMVERSGYCVTKEFPCRSILDVWDAYLVLLSSLAPHFKPKYSIARKLQKIARRKMHQHMPDIYVGGGSLIEAFVRTLATNRNAVLEEMSDEAYEAFWRNPISSEAADKDSRVQQLRRSVTGSMTSHLYRRKLIITQRGYLGLAPDSTAKGDLVCVLYGCSVPCILRQKGDHLALVGESYVHGLMNGEAIDQLANGEVEERMFVLR